MALPSSGALSLSQVAVELNRAATAQTSLGEAAVRNLAGIAGGAIGMAALRGKSAAIVYTASDAASLNLATAFGTDYGAAVEKRLVVPAGVTLGPVTIPTGLGGGLTIENAGEIQGLGGASNGGAGGDAITASGSFTLINTGAVRGGGGGGGPGGTGGQGSVQSETTITEGPRGDGSNQWRRGGVCAGDLLKWNGSTITTSGLGTNTQFTSGNVTYTKGSLLSAPQGRYVCGFFIFSTAIAYHVYQVARSYTSTVTSYTSGGAGGAGGLGRGYGQMLAAGGSGASGGTNAGTGGTGGAGGDWGEAGSTGSAGANGTHSSGAAGSPGGAAGRAVRMLAGSLTLTNSGTLNGAT